MRLTSLIPNSLGDGRGHGTLVAGLAAGAASRYAGAAPTAPIVSIDVMDDNGMALTSDVIAAADWILPTTVAYAPGNDPFIITVGASDTNGIPWTAADDFAAPWTAFGYTLDGFAKPDIGAPGRQLIGSVPGTSTMVREHPERVTAAGYMWMSGTSFAAPIVSGAAALVLAHHPNWTPTRSRVPSC